MTTIQNNANIQKSPRKCAKNNPIFDESVFFFVGAFCTISISLHGESIHFDISSDVAMRDTFSAENNIFQMKAHCIISVWH